MTRVSRFLNLARGVGSGQEGSKIHVSGRAGIVSISQVGSDRPDRARPA